MSHPSTSQTDIILAIQDPYVDQIINGTKTYEFRKHLVPPTVSRIWFYRTAPHSRITHVCEILPARTRGVGDEPLEEDGVGNAEYNARHPEWEGYDFAYRIVGLWELWEPITLDELMKKYGFEAAPRGVVDLPREIGERVAWEGQRKVLNRREKGKLDGAEAVGEVG